jgi:hypothetical protein
MTRRPRRTPAVAAAWSAGAVLLAANTAALAASAARNHADAALMATVATAYIATLTLGQALAYGCSLAWHAGRPHLRADRASQPPSQRPAYTTQELSQMRQDAAEAEQRHAGMLAAAREASAKAERPVPPGRHGRPQPTPTVVYSVGLPKHAVTNPSSLPWTAPVAGSVGGAR